MSAKKYRHLGQEKTNPEWCLIFPYMLGRNFEDPKYGFEVVEPVEQVGEKDFVDITFCILDPMETSMNILKSVLLKKGVKDIYDSPPKNRFLNDEAGQWDTGSRPLTFRGPKKYTQKEYDQTIVDGFKAAREYAPTPDDHVGVPPLFYKDVQDYLTHKNSSDLSSKQSPSMSEKSEPASVSKDWVVDCFQKDGRNYWRQISTGRYTNMPFEEGFSEQYGLDNLTMWKVMLDRTSWYIGENAVTNSGRGEHKIIGFKVIDGDMCAELEGFKAQYEFLSKLQKPSIDAPKEPFQWETILNLKVTCDPQKLFINGIEVIPSKQ